MTYNYLVHLYNIKPVNILNFNMTYNYLVHFCITLKTKIKNLNG